MRHTIICIKVDAAPQTSAPPSTSKAACSCVAQSFGPLQGKTKTVDCREMNQQRPRLKNGVDLQLQSAFHDGNWPVVVRLAEKRARTFNDQYYEVGAYLNEISMD